jgi:hypothetical protein
MLNMVDMKIYSLIEKIIFVVAAFLYTALLLYLNDWSAPKLRSGWFAMIWQSAGSGVIAVVLFQFFFKKYLWRKPFLRGILVNYPDLTGTWFATSISETFGTKFKTVVHIKHNFDSLRYSSFRLKSVFSASFSASSFRLEGFSEVSREESLHCGLTRQNDKVRLYIIYENKVQDGEKYSTNHTGCRSLILEDEEKEKERWFFVDHYWTDKKWKPVSASGIGGTRGYGKMEWKCHELLSSDDSVVRDFFSKP